VIWDNQGSLKVIMNGIIDGSHTTLCWPSVATINLSLTISKM